MADARGRTARMPISLDDRPVSSLLLPIPILCFVGGLLTDLAYQGSGGNLLWVNFSSWLIAAGLLFGALAGLVILIDTFRRSVSWLAFVLLLAAWIVEFVNSLVHARDGWTAVVPLGLTLSAIAAVLILIAGWLARFRHAREGGGV
jgi:uncharacterized membrane protein